MTRQDMAAFLYRLAGTPNRDLDTDGAFIYSYFRDVNWSTPHAEDIWWLAMKKISTGWIVTSQPSPLPSHPNQVYYKNCAAVRPPVRLLSIEEIRAIGLSLIVITMELHANDD